jgi:hypothetical protein
MDIQELAKQMNDKRAIIEEIHHSYPKVPFPDVSLEPVFYGRRGRTIAEGKYAIIDQSKPEGQQLFGIASDQYTLVFHEEVVHKVHEVLNELPEYGAPDIDIRLPNNGGKLKMVCTFTDVEHTITNGNNPDKLNPKIEVFNSYDLGWKFRCLFGAYRLVCSNGLVIGDVFGQYSNRHVRTLSTTAFKEAIELGMVNYSEQIGLWRKWAEMQINQTQYDEVWEGLPLSENQQKEIEELPEARTKTLLLEDLRKNDLTLWQFQNVVTQYVTHEIPSEVRRTNLEPQIARVFENEYLKAA